MIIKFDTEKQVELTIAAYFKAFQFFLPNFVFFF